MAAPRLRALVREYLVASHPIQVQDFTLFEELEAIQFMAQGATRAYACRHALVALRARASSAETNEAHTCRHLADGRRLCFAGVYLKNTKEQAYTPIHLETIVSALSLF